MIRSVYRINKTNNLPIILYSSNIRHSAKGSVWEDHKYIKRIDGTYYYPNDYQGGRHLPNDKNVIEDNKMISKVNLNENDIDNLAKEVIRGNFGNGKKRKDLSF